MAESRALLAVDLGVRTAYAFFDGTGTLRWYRSHNFGTATRLRRGVPGLLDGLPELTHLVVEGGGALARAWADEAAPRDLVVRWVSAETWRAALLYPREQRSGEQAKRRADTLARRVIAWSGAARPAALRHDTAEAILIGFWAVLDLGWIAVRPVELLHSASVIRA